MVKELYKLYRPITATPFSCGETYIEIPPCETLAPYICCFWGTSKNIKTVAPNEIQNGVVIPDTCMDIIWEVDFTNNQIGNSFCGIQDISFISSSKNISVEVCTFAIRFYAWAVILFADEDMKSVLNSFFDTGYYFKDFKYKLESALLNRNTIAERIEITEKYLLQRINKNRENHNVMNSIYKMLISRGNVSIKELTEYASVSPRQLERLFKQVIGTSPKQFTNLLRYQYLWQDIVCRKYFNVQDAVFKYGYCDQAHLLNDFKSYHTMTPTQAKEYALKSN
ncbi:AraC-like DNA-binding protein [Anaerobacterium chartisolvens]|uniref:AraC-like DNA-binding protein n=1 Tax=Anaerobacterium chartisolvens TaxID=1297424 RepID=A0A369BIW5_9FIRM|nr:helix-turn-helix domain-containing protein [Anaerobacterium chartisolvens]RCX21095.1 AraC-like DNA-binding protein [Anaerobacterium chartisolvens]